MSLLDPMPTIDEARVLAAIAAAEQRTSGELRVVIARHHTTDAMASARLQFERLGMVRTAARNGVLIYLAPRSHAFAVIGDRGIHEKCGDDFWQRIAAGMADAFKRDDFTGGILLAIERAAEALARHFPRRPDDRNELPDTIEKT